LKLRVYHGDKQQVRHQLLEAIDEAAVGVWNELGCMQWHNNWQHAWALQTCGVIASELILYKCLK
jgi:hypothetical protein